MDVQYVKDEGGITSAEGFVERREGLETRFVRVPGANIELVIETPKIVNVVSYRALKDARRTETTPSFPGQQHSNDLDRSITTIISGRARLSGLGARRRTTISALGSLHRLSEINVRLESANLDNIGEITGFHIDWFSKEYIEPNGGFLLDGRLMQRDLDLLVEDLRATEGTLVMELKIGCFPGFFGEWSFEGWDGGELKYANREICARAVANHQAIPDDFFEPEQPFRTRVDTAGPHDLISLMVVGNAKTRQTE